MNLHSEERGSSGINILWPDTSNALYKAELARTKLGGSPNNISCIVKYSLQAGATVMWMGDLETTFMANIEADVSMPLIDVLFAPHHGRDTPPDTWLDEMDPGVVVIGEGPSEYQDPYTAYNKIRQNSAGDITFECVEAKIHIYVANYSYSVGFLTQEAIPNTYGKYIGTLLSHT